MRLGTWPGKRFRDRAAPQGFPPKKKIQPGATLRIYDPVIDAWHIFWSDPLQQYYTRQIGRKKGSDIVQEGTNDAGELSRWSFTNITSDSFRWHGEHSTDQGKNWKLQAEFYAQHVTT